MRRAPQHAAGLAALSVNKLDPKILQDFLAQKFALSRRAAKAAIDGRNVWVNRKCVWIARYALQTGDLVEIPTVVVKGAQRQGATADRAGGATARPSAAPAARRHVRVLWSDANYLVCDKPAGLVSCDDPKSAEAILRVQENVPTLEAVHRLDRDTTGCLLFAKSHAAFLAAVEVFKTHKVSKIYHAIVVGRFPYAHQIIDAPLDGQPAVSRVAREGASADASFLRVRIETGRTNQIRRHLASVRFPIVGDRVFGLKRARDARLLQVPRQMLHASTLTLPNPLDLRAEIKAHAPLPADFRATLRLFGMGK
ncbi:MAG: RluA family pseudouridine synthase [Kiritimatiellia bacterium]|nr:RluA family pseudouridine synthase [Kiritimatiellia bacterium]